MRKTLIVGIILICIIMVSGCINPPPPPTTSDTVFIYPTTIYADLDTEFTVTVMCNVNSYIKAWDCEVEFDRSKLYPVKVEISKDLFNDYSTFFSPNVLIDEYSGNITRIYAVLLGENFMIRKSGVLFNMTFITDTYGTAEIKLRNCSLYNETSPIKTNVINATIVITSVNNIPRN